MEKSKNKKSSPLKHPQTMYYHQKFPMQKQEAPGLQHKMNPQPDCGETSYFVRERLAGRKR